METTLILKNDGRNFEQMYYRAICMGELRRAEQLYAEYKKNPTNFYWRDAYQKNAIQDTVLMSAIINLLDMPFGSYVFTCINDERIEIAPWLYGEDLGKQALIAALDRETADAQQLYTYARTISLTADFLVWLQNYNKKNAGAGEKA